MRKIVAAAVLLALLFPLTVFGKRKEFVKEYEETLFRISKNYKEALRAPESRFGKEYEEGLDRFVALSRVLQKGAGVWGRDFNFQKLAMDVENMYKRTRQFLNYQKDGDRTHTLTSKDFKEKKMRNPYTRDNYDNNKRSNRNRNISNRDKSEQKAREFLVKHDPLPLLKILSNDLKNLKTAGFLEGGKVGRIQRQKIQLDEYKRLVDFYRNHYRYFLYRKISGAYESEIRRRGDLMSGCALNIMNTLGNANGAVLPCNLAEETRILLRASEFYSSSLKRGEMRGRSAGSHHNRQEVNYSFQKIHKTLALLQRNFGSSVPEKTAEDRDNSVVEEMKNLSPAELVQRIGKLRREIFSGNTLMSGIDDDTLRKFRSTLGSEESKEYEKIRKEYQKNGYSGSEAARYSCVQLLNKGVRKMAHNELQRIYRRCKKELTSERERELEL